MGQYDGFGFEDENTDQGKNESGDSLRKARDAAAKKAQDLETKVNELTAQLTERTLKDVLQAKSLNPGLAKWMGNDGVDGSDESKVDAWLTENAALIGYKPKSAEESREEDPRASEFKRMQGALDNALPAGKFTEAESMIDKAEDIASVNKILAQARQFG